MMKKQTFYPRNIATHDVSLISRLGVERAEGEYCWHPERSEFREGKDWGRRQICRDETFILVAGEGYKTSLDSTAYTEWEDYIKINFRLSGKLTTVLDGYGQYDHDRPEVFIVCGPREMMKVDVIKAGVQTAGVALSVLRDFFPTHMGIAPEELPEPLRSLALPEQQRPYGFHQLQLTPDLAASIRSILAAPFEVRRTPVYARAKAVELMCLLLNQMTVEQRAPRATARARNYQQSRLHEARELLTRRYAEPVTLEWISKEVGLNRMALTSGFRQLFGMSVYDCLQKERMERAYELLQDDTYSIAQVAEAVGYSHSCTFSTAFHSYFGCSPRKARTATAR